MILAFGLLCAFLGVVYLLGCFKRLDSPSVAARVAGDEAKLAKLHSLQGAWDKLGKTRQFFASSSGYLIMAVGLLLLWHDKSIAKFYWAIPVLYATNLIILLQVKRYADTVLDTQSIGQADVLRVIKLQIRMCITFSIVFVVLATSV